MVIYKSYENVDDEDCTKRFYAICLIMYDYSY